MNLATSGAIGIIAATGLAFLAGCDDTEVTIGASAPIARPVKVATAQQRADEVSRIYPGFVNANESVRLSFEVAGRLVEYPVNNGSSLKAGEIIGRLDPLDYQNQVDAAQALVTAAGAKLERMRRAHEKNAVSEIEVIEQQAALDSAVARLNITQKSLDDTELRAPYDGVVARRLTNSYAVSSGVLVPTSALFATPNGDTHVWVINRDSMIVSKRHVRQGGIAEGAMATILDGLEPGEMVASAGVNHLDDGVTVRPLNLPQLSASDR